MVVFFAPPSLGSKIVHCSNEELPPYHDYFYCYSSFHHRRVGLVAVATSAATIVVVMARRELLLLLPLGLLSLVLMTASSFSPWPQTQREFASPRQSGSRGLLQPAAGSSKRPDTRKKQQKQKTHPQELGL